MTANDWPPLVIAVCGLLFLVLGIAYPWISAVLGAEAPRPERRLMSIVLGCALLALWSIWLSVD
jgi:hypothetical protein